MTKTNIKHPAGYNCVQPFLRHFSKELKLDKYILFALSEGSRRGVGALEKMCCSPIIMSIIASYRISDRNLNRFGIRQNSYACANS